MTIHTCMSQILRATARNRVIAFAAQQPQSHLRLRCLCHATLHNNNSMVRHSGSTTYLIHLSGYGCGQLVHAFMRTATQCRLLCPHWLLWSAHSRLPYACTARAFAAVAMPGAVTNSHGHSSHVRVCLVLSIGQVMRGELSRDVWQRAWQHMVRPAWSLGHTITVVRFTATRWLLL